MSRKANNICLQIDLSNPHAFTSPLLKVAAGAGVKDVVPLPPPCRAASLSWGGGGRALPRDLAGRMLDPGLGQPQWVKCLDTLLSLVLSLT